MPFENQLFVQIFGGPKLDRFIYLKVGIWNPTIWNPHFLKAGFQMVLFSNGRALAIAMVKTIHNGTIQKPDVYVRISNVFLTK